MSIAGVSRISSLFCLNASPKLDDGDRRERQRPWTWGCNGFSGGTTAQCSASLAQQTGQIITSISLSNNSFTGGSGAGATVGAVTVTMSPASPPFSGTLSLTGSLSGSGNDANNFQISGSTLETLCARTCQPGQYAIKIVATQAGTTTARSRKPRRSPPLARAERAGYWHSTTNSPMACSTGRTSRRRVGPRLPRPQCL